MAESFYGNLIRSIGDKLSGANKPAKEPKAPKEKKSKEGTPAEPKAAKPAKAGKGIPVGRVLVDLTPEAYRDAIKTRELKKNWVFVVAGTFALSVLALSLIFTSGLPLRTDLDSKLNTNTQLQAALGQYQDINQAVDQMGATKDKLNQAAGGEIDWSSLISSLEGALPSGTSVKSIGININASSSEKSAAILISFVADSPLGYADTLKAIQSAQGVSNVQVGGLTSTDGGYSFSATMDYDTSIRTNRFAPSTATGGN